MRTAKRSRSSRSGTRTSFPSVQLCRTVLADPAIRLYRPVLAGISRVPVLRPDRVTLLEAQGVDASTIADLLAGPADRADPGQAQPQRGGRGEEAHPQRADA